MGADALKDSSKYCGPSCTAVTNARELGLLEFASYNDLTLANTLGKHKKSRCWTWHAPNGTHHNQIDYILVQNRFRSGINRAKTRNFCGVDLGSDRDLVLLNFRIRLKKTNKPKNIRLKFNLDRLKDPTIAEYFPTTIGGKLAAMLALDEDAETLTTSFNTVMTETATGILEIHGPKPLHWVTDKILDMCDKRRYLKKF